jgi:cobalt-zinc-cadmium efflux system protein
VATSIFAFLSGSIGLWADTAHSFFDSSSVFLSLGIIIAIERSRRSLEWKIRRFGSHAAFALLIGITGLILAHSVHRLANPVPVGALTMMLGALVNGTLNAIIAYYSHRTPEGERTSTHVQFHLHVIGDLLTSVAVVIGSLLILLFGWEAADGATGLLVVAYMAFALIPRSFETAFGTSHRAPS